MARRLRVFRWTTIPAILLLLAVAALYVVIVLFGPDSVADLDARLSREPVDAGPVQAFRWFAPPRAAIPSASYRWLAGTQVFPQARRAWHGQSRYLDSRGDWQWSSKVGLLWGQVRDRRHGPWLDPLNAQDADGIRRLISERLAMTEAPHALCLFALDFARWARVCALLALAADVGGRHDVWGLDVRLHQRGFSHWRWSPVREPVEPEAKIGLEGIESDGRWRVVLHADGEDVAFPPEPTAQELLEEVRIRHPFHGEGPEAGWSMPWESPRFVAAANRVWPAAESALQRAAQGRRAVVLECVETESAPIRFGYVVAVLDILLAEGVEVVRFEPEGLALRFDVPPIPEPLPAWQPPEIPPGRLLWIVGILGALFAIVVSGQTRPRSGAGA